MRQLHFKPLYENVSTLYDEEIYLVDQSQFIQ